MIVIYINGYFYELMFIQYFLNLFFDCRVKVDFSVLGVIVVKIDVMLNWYVVVCGLEFRIFESIKGESLKFVGLFNLVFKWKCFV